MVVAKDKSEALLTCVQVLAEANKKSFRICPKGLDPEANYQMNFVGKTATSCSCQEDEEMGVSVIRPEKRNCLDWEPEKSSEGQY